MTNEGGGGAEWVDGTCLSSTPSPSVPAYRPSTAIHALGPAFYDPVEPADFPETTLRYRDDRAAESVGLGGLSDQDWIAHFARFRSLPDNLPKPLALRYHGHQFRHYNPDIGDGRGFLHAQVLDGDDRLLDLGTKGSGRTPYSRDGDGRLTLLGGVREVLATRYLEHMGVNTSRSLSLVETGEALQRGDEPSPTRSSVLVRLSHSHIRFGTFQRLYALGGPEETEALVAYCIRHFYPEASGAEEMFGAAVAASADTVASWMAAGFVHGVMNTDNMNITGESFDYGPYRFLPHLDPGFTAAYFDRHGLYAFARQPEAMAWNLAQLAQALSSVADEARLLRSLEGFAAHYRDALSAHALRRLHLESVDPEVDARTVAELFTWLEATRASWPHAWHDLKGGPGQMRLDGSPNAELYIGAEWERLRTQLARHTPLGEVEQGPPATLFYDEIGELWAPIRDSDDWSAFHGKLDTFTRAE